MLNLPQNRGAAARCASTHLNSPRLTRRRPGRFNIGADHIAAEYLDERRVADRRTELEAQGYPAPLATLAVRLEGRENTLLDGTDAGLTAAGEAELSAVQALLWELHKETRPQAEASAATSAEAAPVPHRSDRLATLGTYDPTLPLRERLRRLLNARASSLRKLTGEDLDETRHAAVFDATDGRLTSSMDRRLVDDEMSLAVSYVEDRLYAAGFDFDAEDAAYFARRLQRIEAMYPSPYALAA